MILRRFTTQFAIWLGVLGAACLAISFSIILHLFDLTRREQAVAFSETEASELLSKIATGSGSAADNAVAAIQPRATMADSLRNADCRVIRARGIYLLAVPGSRGDYNSDRATWAASRRFGETIRIDLPKGTGCLTQPTTAWGVTKSFRGGEFAVAQIVEYDERFRWLAVLSGVSALIAFVALAALTASLLGRAFMRRVRALNMVLDQVEASGFTVRAEVEGTELGELAQHVNEMIARMGALTGNLSRLSIHIAHDLRSPLDVLQRKLGRLREQLGQPGNEIALDEARAQVDGLMRRCVQLLEIVRIETASRTMFASVEIRAQLTMLIDDMFEDLAAERDLSIALDAPEEVAVIGLVDILQRLFANLLQNAVKFAHPGSIIRVTLRSDGGRACVTIDNDGPIIPAAQHASIFEPSVAAPATAGGGYGLGLPFVRAAARRHGGDAIAEILPGGMRMTVFLASRP